MLQTMFIALAGSLGLDPSAVPTATEKPPSTRLLAHLCRRADPKVPGGKLIAEFASGAVRYEDGNVSIVRAVAGDLDPEARRGLVEISRKDLSAVANCIRREGLARPFDRRSHGMLYMRSGVWKAGAATRRIRQYFPDDQDEMGNVYGPAERSVYWDSERRRLLVLEDFFDRRRRGDFAALICRKLREHPQPEARALPCPSLSQISADLLKPHCLDSERIARVRFWVAEPRTEMKEFPNGWNHFGVDMDAAGFIEFLTPGMRPIFASETSAACPAVA
jgi:hypothetical protein